MKYNQVEPFIDNDDIKNVSDYLSSGGWVTEHNKTFEFENLIKNYVGRKYCVAVPNGTIAIYLSLLAAGITEGKKIAIPNLTMIASINAALWAKASPILVDVDETLCLSLEKLKKIKNLDAVMFVPLNGRTGDGSEIAKWCKENNIVLIEDSAHSLTSSYNEQKCGSLGDISIISFTPHKIITMGQGGMILTDNESFYKKIIELKTFNRSKDKSDWHEGFGLNFKITDLQASLGISQFNKLEIFSKNKVSNHKIYMNKVSNKNVQVLPFKDKEVPWFFDIKLKTIKYKNQLQQILLEKGIETRNFYPALSKQKYLKKYSNENLEYSEKVFDKLLWLPSSNNLSKSDIINISKTINAS